MQTLAGSQKWFVVGSGELTDRLDPGYYSPQSKRISELRARLEEVSATTKLRDIIIDYSSGEWGAAEQDEAGSLAPIKVLRNTNFVNKGNLSYDDCPERYVSAAQFKRTLLRKNDMLVEKSGGSPDQPVGRVALFEQEEDGRYGFSNFLMRLRINEELFIPKFVFIYLKVMFRQGYTEALQSHTTGIRNLRVQDFLEVPVLLLPRAVQENIISLAETAHCLSDDSADDEVQSRIDALLQDELGLSVKHHKAAEKWFTIWSDQLDGILSPAFVGSPVAQDIPTIKLAAVASINPHRRVEGLSDSDEVPYIGLPQTSNKKVDEVLLRPYQEVRGRQIVNEGDILFARIEPSIFNKKYIYVDSLMGHAFAFTSTEFIVIRAEAMNTTYLFNVLFNSFVYDQFAGKTTGSTGRRRLGRSTLAAVHIPVADANQQSRIAEGIAQIERHAATARQQRIALREQGWANIERLIFG